MPKRLAALAALAAAALALPAWADEQSDSKPAAGGTNPAEMFAQLDGNKDGQLTADEVPEERKRLFERLVRTADKNSDGKLNGEEFAAGLSGDADKPDAPAGPPRDRKGKGDREGKGGRDPRQLFRRLDANGDGKATLDEVPEERREKFEKLLGRGDKDGDKALSQEEFAQAIPGGDDSPGDKPPGDKGPGDKSKKGKRPEGRPDPREFFRRLDANGDGKVTLDEVPEPVRPRIEQLLGRADTDGDKAISLEEFSAMPRPGKPPEGQPRPPRPEGRPPRGPGGPPPGLFGALDGDHNDKLSGEEISAAAEVIRKLDKDGDGSVTVEELSAARPDRERKD